MNPVWECWEGEPPLDYERFSLYRELGPRRSLEEAADRCGLSLARVKQLSARWQWIARAITWDGAQATQRRRRELEEVEQSQQRHLKEAADWQRLARAAIAGWVRRNASGELELTQDLTPFQAMRLWRIGFQAERRLRGDAPSPIHDQAWLKRLADAISNAIERVSKEAADGLANELGIEADNVRGRQNLEGFLIYFVEQLVRAYLQDDSAWHEEIGS